MAYTAKDIINRASWILKDDDNVRWTRATLLDYVNEAQETVVRMDPEANDRRAVINLVRGTVQKLPKELNASQLFTVVCNVFDKDSQLGPPIRLTTRSIFDALFDNWHEEPEDDIVENYIFDDRTRTEFYVYPPNTGYGRVQVVYCKEPSKITDEDQELEIDDHYATCVTNYVLYKAALLDSDYNGTTQLASLYYQAFMNELNTQEEAATKMGPGPAHSSAPIKSSGGTE